VLGVQLIAGIARIVVEMESVVQLNHAGGAKAIAVPALMYAEMRSVVLLKVV